MTILGVVLSEPRNHLAQVNLGSIVLQVTQVLVSEQLHQGLQLSSDGVGEECIILNQGDDVLGPVHQTLSDVTSVR